MADVELIPTTSISVSRLQIQKTSHLSWAPEKLQQRAGKLSEHATILDLKKVWSLWGLVEDASGPLSRICGYNSG